MEQGSASVCSAVRAVQACSVKLKLASKCVWPSWNHYKKQKQRGKCGEAALGLAGGHGARAWPRPLLTVGAVDGEKWMGLWLA